MLDPTLNTYAPAVSGASGAMSPTLNAVFVGEELLDTTSKKWCKAVSVGMGSTDQVALNCIHAPPL